MHICMPFIQVTRQVSQPVRQAGLTVRMVSRVVQVQWPNYTGGIIWNRPVAVCVSSDDGSARTLPVRDATARWLLVILASMFGILIIAAYTRK